MNVRVFILFSVPADPMLHYQMITVILSVYGRKIPQTDFEPVIPKDLRQRIAD